MPDFTTMFSSFAPTGMDNKLAFKKKHNPFFLSTIDPQVSMIESSVASMS